MKSEPGLPLSCLISGGVPVSAAATTALGRRADGRGLEAAAGESVEVAALATLGEGAVAAAPATATPAKNLRRLNLVRDSERAMPASHCFQTLMPVLPEQSSGERLVGAMLVQRQVSRYGV
jgi:hypothetical protein